MKYQLFETNIRSNQEVWNQELTLKEARALGKKSNFDIVKIFTDDKNVKLIEMVKEYNWSKNEQ